MNIKRIQKSKNYSIISNEILRRKDLSLKAKGLMSLIKTTIDNQINDLIKNGIKVKIIGEVSSLPKSVLNKLNQSMELTKDNNKLILNLAINYGSRNEIINAIKIISTEVANNDIKIDDINEDLFTQKLYTYPSPSPDLLIRTGGEFRLSNFLLWQLAYSEIIINKKYWPDYKTSDLEFDIKEYTLRERRFGKTSEQID